MYLLYKYLSILLSPLVDLYILIRLLLGKEDIKRIRERFALPTVDRPNGDVIWILCASVGESVASFPLIKKLLEKYDNKITILITSTTKTSAKLIVDKIKNNGNIIHQYTPIDKYYTILRFIKFWKPIALINIESEIWPNTIILSHKYCKKVIIATAKMSNKSFRRWKKFKMLRKTIFKAIDICYPQSKDDNIKLKKLGIDNCVIYGNLKFETNKVVINQEYLKELQDSIKDRKFILFASAHIEEIEYILKLKQKLKDILFIIAIRHPDKSCDFYNFFIRNGYSVNRKSKCERIAEDTDIYIYDEMGEMGTLYTLSDIVVMCGSFVKNIGGHNPIEVAQCSCAIITAPFIKNNSSLFRELEKNDACIINKNRKKVINEMFIKLNELLNDDVKVKILKTNAFNILQKFSHIAENMAVDIKKQLE
ncbi:MAG: 3-deoxy-D-manno-octulosonic acid transferase [Rickettsiales bacterium]|jgi:3-deoxy-D-manno-octulosonic-acid transferase|nr:3-deoxy-D-manno-octulosonic acid transferase [Rickettsiales bacterium]